VFLGEWESESRDRTEKWLVLLLEEEPPDDATIAQSDVEKQESESVNLPSAIMETPLWSVSAVMDAVEAATASYNGHGMSFASGISAKSVSRSLGVPQFFRSCSVGSHLFTRARIRLEIMSRVHAMPSMRNPRWS
jgi:hypothetical protein